MDLWSLEVSGSRIHCLISVILSFSSTVQCRESELLAGLVLERYYHERSELYYLYYDLF